MRARGFWLGLLLAGTAACSRLYTGLEDSVEVDTDGDLVSLTDEPAGAHCPDGGLRIDTGRDTDGDGVLAASEVTSTSYVCDGRHGVDGGTGPSGPGGDDAVAALVEVTTDAAVCGGLGGERVRTGLDTNFNQTLDASEISGDEVVCNGTVGPTGPTGAGGGAGDSPLRALVAVTPAIGCAVSGQHIAYGLDIDADGLLDAGAPPAGEVEGEYEVCDGAGSTGSGAEGGRQDGSLGAPRLITVADRQSGIMPLRSTLPAAGSSYYRFVTLTESSSPAFWQAPYTLTLLGLESNVEPMLFAVADFSGPVDLHCLRIDVDAVQCVTDGPLDPGASYYLRVDELDHVGNGYFISVAFGGFEGLLAPVDFNTRSTYFEGTFSGRGAVGGDGGVSVYEFVADGSDDYSLSFQNAVTQSGQPTARGTAVYDASDVLLTSCASDVCPVGGLVDGEVYRIEIDGQGGPGAAFDFQIEHGDASTPTYALGTTLFEGELSQFIAPADGDLLIAIQSSSGFVRIFDSLREANAENPAIECSTSCMVTGLDPGQPYYLRSQRDYYAVDALSFSLLDNTDPDGAIETPLSLPLETPTSANIVEDFGYYSFATTVAGYYTLSSAGPAVGVGYTLSDSETFATTLQNGSLADGSPVVTPYLAAATTYYLRATVYFGVGPVALTVSAEDDVTPTVALAPAVNVFDAGQQIARVPLVSEALVRLTLANETSSTDLELCASSTCAAPFATCRGHGAGCSLIANGNRFSVYFRVSPVGFGAMTQLIADPLDTTPLDVGSPAAQSLAAGEQAFFAFVPTQTAHTVAIDCSSSGGPMAFEPYAPTFADGVTYFAGGCTNGSQLLATMNTLVVDELHYFSVSAAAAVTFDLTVQP